MEPSKSTITPLPETGFVRLPNIIGDCYKQSAYTGYYSGIKKHLVGRGQIRPLSQAGQTGATHYGVAGGGDSIAYPKNAIFLS